MMNGIQFQSVQTPNTLSSELRSVIRDNVLQFYVQGNGMDTQEEGITALYERLSQEDKLDGESNSIANQKKILERYCKDHGYTAIRHYDEDDGAAAKTVRLDLGRKTTCEVWILDETHDGTYLKDTDDLTFTLPPHTCLLIKEK